MGTRFALVARYFSPLRILRRIRILEGNLADLVQDHGRLSERLSREVDSLDGKKVESDALAVCRDCSGLFALAKSDGTRNEAVSIFRDDDGKSFALCRWDLQRYPKLAQTKKEQDAEKRRRAKRSETDSANPAPE